MDSHVDSQGVIQVTESASTLMAILFGLGVFAIIVAVGWRSVQNRRILRLRGADGQETIIIAREDDEISSIVTTSETIEPAPVVEPATEFGRDTAMSEAAAQADADAAARDRLHRVVSSTE